MNWLRYLNPAYILFDSKPTERKADAQAKSFTDNNLVFLEGLACVGKTTICKEMQKKGHQVVFNDFYEMCQLFPLLQYKHEDNIACGLAHALESLNLVQHILDAWSKGDRNILCDRSPLASVVYSFIMKYYNRRYRMFRMPSDKELNIFCSQIESVYAILEQKIPIKFNIIVFICSNPEYILKNMIKRGNGIDILDISYVKIQNLVFKQIAKKLNLQLFDIANMDYKDFIIKM